MRRRTTILKAGQSSDLRVYFKDSQLTSDVSSIQIAIWNAGKEPVRAENILSKSIIVRMEPRTRILEARVTRASRPVTRFRCAQDGPESVSCMWDILEKDDGGLLELIYLGATGGVAVDGTIEGRRGIRRIGSQSVRNWNGIAVAMTVSILLNIPMLVLILRRRKSIGTIAINLALLTTGIVGSLVSVFLIHMWFPPCLSVCDSSA